MMNIHAIETELFRKQQEVLFWEYFHRIPTDFELSEFMDLLNKKEVAMI